MTYVVTKDEFIISTEKKKLDITYLHQFLSKSYWSPGIPLDVIKKAIKCSLTFGVYHNDNQIGFARMITDSATFAYLADVFIDESYRGKGLSKWPMEAIIGHPDLKGLRRIMLATKDAHGLYEKFGFTLLTNAGIWMHIHNPKVYETK